MSLRSTARKRQPATTPPQGTPVIQLPGTEHLTDLGNAKRFARIHGADLSWVPEWDTWVHWTGSHWQPTPDESVRRFAHDVVEQMRTEADTLKGERKQDLIAHALKSESSMKVSAMLKEAQALLAVSADRFDANPYLYNCLNGTVDLSPEKIARRLKKSTPEKVLPRLKYMHRREDYITKIVPVKWDPKAACPRFRRFLGEVFAGDSDVADFVLRTMATCLVGDSVEQSFHLWFGRKGRNGKGVLQRLLGKLTDPYRVTVDPKLFFSSFKYDPNAPSSAVMALRNARVVEGSEMEKEEVIGGAFLKRYTGGDNIAGRDLHEKQRDTRAFKPSGTLIISTNHFPQADPTDDALWARFRIVEFPVRFGEAGGPPIDVTLEEQLETELPGILTLVVREWLTIQQADKRKVCIERGLLDAPDKVLETTRMVRSTFGPLGLWILERCVTGENEREAPRVLYVDYLRWAAAQDMDDDEIMSETRFGKQMGIMKFRKKESSGKAWRLGIRLKTEEETAPPPAQIPMNLRDTTLE